MIINRQNYEVILIDYLDGKLNSTQVEELMIFLKKNPDIQEEIDGIENFVLVEETISFPGKSSLKKNSFRQNGIENEFDYLCIADIEGVITSEEKGKLNGLIQNNPELGLTYQKYNQTILNKQAEIIYPKKENLKRLKVIPIRLSTFRIASGIAASVAIIITTYTIYDRIYTNPSITGLQKAKQELAKTIQIPVQNEVIKESPVVEVKPKTTVQMAKAIEIDEVTIIQSNEKDTIIPEFVPSPIVGKSAIPIKTTLETKNEMIALAELSIYYTEAYIQNEKPIQLGYYNQYHTKEIGLFEVIQYGVKSIARLMGKEVKLEADKDEKGKIKKINFESNLIAFSAPVGKNE